MNNVLKSSLICLTAFAMSCQPPATPPAAQAPVVVQPPAHPENGRYQVIVGNEGTAGAVLFLLDTREGGTWIYRPPTQMAFNGFWSDIPRITYPENVWKQVFENMMRQAAEQQKAAQEAAAAAAAQPKR